MLDCLCGVAPTAILAAIAPQTKPSPVDTGLPFTGEELEAMVVISKLSVKTTVLEPCPMRRFPPVFGFDNLPS